MRRYQPDLNIIRVCKNRIQPEIHAVLLFNRIIYQCEWIDKKSKKKKILLGHSRKAGYSNVLE